MKQNSPPVIFESLLEALGAGTTFRDAIIGDMAEEFAWRVERDGRVSAWWWYSQQALRTTPHLLRSWSKEEGAIRHVARVVGVSFTAATMITTLTLLVLTAAKSAIGVPTDAMQRPFADLQPHVVGGMLLLQSLSPLCGGFVAARFDRRSPLVSVFALALLWSVAFLVSSAFIPVSGVREQWRFATFAIVLLGTCASGLVGVWSKRAVRAKG